MQPDFVNQVIYGNAATEGLNRWGWFVGHFITPKEDPRATEVVEVKWGIHKAGDCRKQWSVNGEVTTLSILINGRFRLQFLDREILLLQEGDYVIWSAGVPHCWVADADCVILTVRWPSRSGDSVEFLL